MSQRTVTVERTSQRDGAPIKTVTTTVKDPASKRAKRRERRLNAGKAKLKDLEPALSKLSIPRNEQDRLMTIINDSGESSKVQLYVACLTAPKMFRSRIPDAYARKTALFGSVMTIDVMANFTGASPNDGRFAMCIQPTLGSLATPHNYKVAMIDSTTAWPKNNHAASAFVTQSNGRDIRLDTIALRLTQPPLASCLLSGFTASTDPAQGRNPFGVTQPTIRYGYGLDVEYFSSATSSIFEAPPGVYCVTINVAALQTSVVGTDPQPFNINVTSINGLWTPWQSTYSASPDDATNVQIVSTTTGLWRCNPAAAGVGGGNLSITTPQCTLTTAGQCSISFTPAFDDNASIQGSFNYGDLAEYRPVACSALFTSASSPLVTGGMVCASLLPAGADRTQYFGGSTNPIGNLDAWENLAQLPGSYNGPLKDGAYAWYSPADNDDVAMYSPNDALDHKYPTLCISGQLTPTGVTITPGTPIMVGRLEVASVYEGITTSQLYDSQMMLGSQAIMDTVNRHLAVQPHAMQNKKHTDFQRSVIKRAHPQAKGHGTPWLATALGNAVPWLVNNRNGVAESIGMLGDLASAVL